MRTVFWDEKKDEICLIDQRLLPGRFEIFTCKSVDEVVFAIRDMVVRGAPAIGATAASAAPLFFQGFESNSNNFYSPTRVARLRRRSTAPGQLLST